MIDLWIIGLGGHARVVSDAALASGCFVVVGLLDDRPEQNNMRMPGVRIEEGVSRAAIARFGIEHAIISIGSNRVRDEIARRSTAWSGGPP